MSRRDQYIKSKSDFVLRKKHAITSVGTIYENDYMTIVPNDGLFTDETTMYSDSNFKFKIRTGANVKKRHFAGNWIKTADGNETWTGENYSGVAITSESRILLKPNYNAITDFAYYGSAQKLIEATVRDVVIKYPGGISYLGSDLDPVDYCYIKEDGTLIWEPESGATAYYQVSNEFGIDIWTDGVSWESVENPMRTLSASFDKYVFGVNGSKIVSLTISGDGNPCLDRVIAATTITDENGDSVTLYTYMDNEGNAVILSKDLGIKGKPIIRVRDDVFEQMYDSLDDFSKVLLNRQSKPMFRASFRIPHFDKEHGYFYSTENFTWPSLCYEGNGYHFNTPKLNGAAFNTYIESLQKAAMMHDEIDSDNIWRMLTHDSLKNLDWTFKINTEGDTDDIVGFDSSRFQAALQLYGRQFDDIKRYADNIKYSNSITYDEKNNLPDYFLTDAAENDGWEAHHVMPLSSNSITTGVIYTGSTYSGYTAADANNSFMRRLAINSDYIQSLKGTIRGLKVLLGLLGFESGNTEGCYSIKEYVAVATQFPNKSELLSVLPYTQGFFDEDMNLLGGWPVVEVSVGDGISYVAPWYSRTAVYNSGLYFQGMGGWKRTNSKKIDIPITSATSINEATYSNGRQFRIYGETLQHMRYAANIDELLRLTTTDIREGLICYVESIEGLLTEGYMMSPSDYVAYGSGATIPYSHYFILKNVDLASHVGFVRNDYYNCYGWRNVFTPEFEGSAPTTHDGASVLYAESVRTVENGNNPHAGYGKYDDGNTYLEYFRQIFKYELDENQFTVEGTQQEISNEFARISGIGFGDCELKVDSKCHAFFDMSEIDRNVLVGMVPHYGNGYLIQTNQVVHGRAVDDEMEHSDSVYSGYTIPSQENAVDKFDESAALSVINVKNINIDFTVSNNEVLKGYIEDVVLKYIEQIIPSTAIFSYTFNGATLLNPADEEIEESYEPIDEEVTCPSDGGSEILCPPDDGIICLLNDESSEICPTDCPADGTPEVCTVNRWDCPSDAGEPEHCTVNSPGCTTDGSQQTETTYYFPFKILKNNHQLSYDEFNQIDWTDIRLSDRSLSNPISFNKGDVLHYYYEELGGDVFALSTTATEYVDGGFIGLSATNKEIVNGGVQYPVTATTSSGELSVEGITNIEIVREVSPIEQEKAYDSSRRLLSGIIVDDLNDEPIFGANVVINGTTIGTTTGLDGEYSIENLPFFQVSTTVTVSCIGYETATIPIGEMPYTYRLVTEV